MELFFLECNKHKIIPMPIFANIKDGLLHIAGRYISYGMASAINLLLSHEQILSKINIVEVNLDDNGLTDKSFALILKAL